MTSTSQQVAPSSFIMIASIIDDLDGLDRSLHVLLSNVIIDIWYAKTIIMWLKDCILEKDKRQQATENSPCVRIILSRQRKKRERECVCVRDVKGILIFLFAILPTECVCVCEREKDLHANSLTLFFHTHTHMWLSFSASRVVTSCHGSPAEGEEGMQSSCSCCNPTTTTTLD